MLDTIPLAERMRPENMEEFFGHDLMMAKYSLLKNMIEKDRLFSFIFTGPPGVGKTTLAGIIAKKTRSHFVYEHGAHTKMEDLRKLFVEAKKRKETEEQNTILFIDEIHRFSTTQQDALLKNVENGTIVLIGATTENPFRELQPALVSRCMVIRLDVLEDKDVKKILKRALVDKEKGLGQFNLKYEMKAIDRIVRAANGDARIALGVLEKCHVFGDGKITLDLVEQVISTQTMKMDRKGNEHYNLIAAWIHATNGSDPQASVYYLARMIAGGVPLEFICRRMVILACEDISLADPMALVYVNNCAQAAEAVGWPEANIVLSSAAVYLALAPKSNSTYKAINQAMEFINAGNLDPIPKRIGDRSRNSAKVGQGVGYKYPHDFPNGWVKQQYLPDSYTDMKFYNPKDAEREKNMYDEWVKRQEG